MSKLKTNTIQHTGGSADNITLDNSQNVTVEGNATVDGTSTLTGNVTASGNLIANGKISIGNDGTYASGDADDLIIGTTSGSANHGLTILSPTNKNAGIYFSDGDNPNGNHRGYFDYNHTTDALNIGTAGTQKVVINSAGSISVPSGQGIDFSATADGNGTDSSELLADYEEGSFTPTVHGWSAGGTATYNSQSGRYIKIGKQVTVWANIDWASISGASGVHALGGLPYAHTSDSYAGACWVHTGNMGDDVVSGFVGNGYSSSILLYRPNSGAQDYMAADTNGGYCKYICTYIANV